MNKRITDKTDARAKARFRLGATIFIVGFLSPALIPLVTATDLPIKLKATISGALALGIPELFSTHLNLNSFCNNFYRDKIWLYGSINIKV